MADNVAITAGAGTSIATDDVGGAHYQRVKLHDGTDGSSTAIPGTQERGLTVDPRRKVVRLSVTPTISTSIYAIKDAVGDLMTFAGAVRASGGSGRIVATQVVDKDQEMAPLDLILFDRTITAPTDNAVFDPSDTELGYVVAVIPIGSYVTLNDNAVADVPLSRSFVLNGTDLFGVLVSQGTPTYTATSDIVVTLTIEQD